MCILVTVSYCDFRFYYFVIENFDSENIIGITKNVSNTICARADNRDNIYKCMLCLQFLWRYFPAFECLWIKWVLTSLEKIYSYIFARSTEQYQYYSQSHHLTKAPYLIYLRFNGIRTIDFWVFLDFTEFLFQKISSEQDSEIVFKIS